MEFTLITGTMDSSANLDGWIITSKTAIVEGAEDLTLQKGDKITINGDVYRNQELIGNIS